MSYDPSWNRSHAPSGDESWQESDAYWFYDAKIGIGGWHRVGQHPDQKTGQDCHFLFVEGGERALSLAPDKGAILSRTEEGQSVGTSYARHVDGDVMNFGWDDTSSSAQLEYYESFYTPRNWKAEAEDAEYSDQVNAAGGHLEVAGRLRGAVRVGNAEYEIDALAHRDKSWGNRNLHEFSALWFSNGTVGPELSWASMMVRMTNGAVMKMGFIVREGMSEDITDILTSVSLSDDGLSSTGAHFKLITPTQELSVPMQPKQGFMQTFPPSMIVTDHCSSVEIDGREGFCDLAVVSNPFRGSFIPTASDVRAICVDEGLSPAADYSQLLLTN